MLYVFLENIHKSLLKYTTDNDSTGVNTIAALVVKKKKSTQEKIELFGTFEEPLLPCKHIQMSVTGGDMFRRVG